jgi:DDE superfamily endonuclease
MARHWGVICRRRVDQKTRSTRPIHCSTYRRNQGTRHLLAVLSPLDRHVVSALRPNRRTQRVLRFLLPAREHELDSLPAGGKLSAILDNLNIHHAAEVCAWAAAPERCDRLELCYAPTNGSWLNLVELKRTQSLSFARS